MERTELGKRTGSYALGLAVSGKRLIFVSGTVGADGNGQVVGKGDVAAQTRQTFQNIEGLLQEAGASLKDVTKITTYIVAMDRYGEYAGVRAEVFGNQPPASATVGVASLYSPEFLIEIEAIAVTD